MSVISDEIVHQVENLDALLINLCPEQKAEVYKKAIEFYEATIITYKSARVELEKKALEALEIESAFEQLLDELRKAAMQVGPIGGVQ